MKMNAIKTKLKFLIILFIYYNSNIAQTIKPLTEIGSKENGFYYKDQLQILDPYIGTWQYTNGNKVLKIKFKKIIKHHVIINVLNSDYYADVLVGGYEYSENGIVLLNTMDQLVTNLADTYDYKLCIVYFISNHAKPRCFICNPNIQRVAIDYEEFLRPNLRSSDRTYIGIKENEPNKLIFSKASVFFEEDPNNTFNTPILPDAVYELTKIAP